MSTRIPFWSLSAVGLRSRARTRSCLCGGWTAPRLDVIHTTGLVRIVNPAVDARLQIYHWLFTNLRDGEAAAIRQPGEPLPKIEEDGWTSQSPRREVHGFGRRPASSEEGSRGVSPRERTGFTATKAIEGAKSASVRAKTRSAGGRTGQVCWDT